MKKFTFFVVIFWIIFAFSLFWSIYSSDSVIFNEIFYLSKNDSVELSIENYEGFIEIEVRNFTSYGNPAYNPFTLRWEVRECHELHVFVRYKGHNEEFFTFFENRSFVANDLEVEFSYNFDVSKEWDDVILETLLTENNTINLKGFRDMGLTPTNQTFTRRPTQTITRKACGAVNSRGQEDRLSRPLSIEIVDVRGSIKRVN